MHSVIVRDDRLVVQHSSSNTAFSTYNGGMEGVQSTATDTDDVGPQKQIHAARDLLYGDFVHLHGNDVPLIQVGLAEREGHVSLYSFVTEDVAIMTQELRLCFSRLHQLLHAVEG